MVYTSVINGRIGSPIKGKIGVLIEEHFDQTEFRKFNEYFPKRGYQVDYISHLWGNSELTFGGNPDNGVVEDYVTVTMEVNDIDPSDYKGIICIGAYAMDRLRYQVSVRKGQKNQAPAVVFLRKAMETNGLKLGAICHSLWLFCADSDLIKGRQVTCAHNIICDVENAGGEVVYEGDATAEIVVDGNLITGKHPGFVDRFMEVFVEEIEMNRIAPGLNLGEAEYADREEDFCLVR
ncbi:DJ-1/PfpI family protein [Iningainema tapete]|uniref:DJ-1/PfpI family protein n=1 Tax=Iningainema tapete BLCC-T55 TaxID=2748662 RepID=A0A8J7BZ54_9CYAN|nr:DJ-1/PfpI family protein [Iningainema tapete]MBD2775173.1 DJ-1/PfpI family protein [Iningainema tapete BLCC-T55]